MKRSDLPRGGLESPLRRAKCCKSAAWVASTGSDQMKRFGFILLNAASHVLKCSLFFPTPSAFPSRGCGGLKFHRAKLFGPLAGPTTLTSGQADEIRRYVCLPSLYPSLWTGLSTASPKLGHCVCCASNSGSGSCQSWSCPQVYCPEHAGNHAQSIPTESVLPPIFPMSLRNPIYQIYHQLANA